MVWRRKRRPAGHPQPSLPPRPVRLSPQTRGESSACGESSRPLGSSCSCWEELALPALPWWLKECVRVVSRQITRLRKKRVFFLEIPALALACPPPHLSREAPFSFPPSQLRSVCPFLQALTLLTDEAGGPLSG